MLRGGGGSGVQDSVNQLGVIEGAQRQVGVESSRRVIELEAHLLRNAKCRTNF